ncbi:putative ribosomal protein S15 [Medicago truncatula]|uniref:Putative ribosomal protein S15 n=1 Tax=Medicago truncatula TaxID=3880 RepID=A0A396JBX0_MEDTR|nr:putative ribosomal protein S15 [Medicago truncatula]
MIKNSFIPVISQKKEEEEEEENPGSVEFQVFNFHSKVLRLTSHLELHPQDYYMKGVYI